MGAGQVRFDDPKNSSPYAFYSNTFTNVTNKGLAYLIPDMRSAGNSLPGYQFYFPCAECGGLVCQGRADGSIDWITIPASDTGAFSTTNKASPAPLAGFAMDLCSDGVNLYAGYSSLAVMVSNNLSLGGGGVGAAGISKSPSTGAFTPTVYCTTAFGTNSQPPSVGSLAYVKPATVGLVAAGPFTDGAGLLRWRMFLPAQDPTPSTEIFTLPAGYWVPQHGITEIAGFVLLAANSGHNSVIYAWDGFTTPYVVCYLPDGDQVTSICSFVGVEVIIGGRRLKPAGNNFAGNGVLYVGQVTAAGQLQLAEIFEIGDGSIIIPLDQNNPTGSGDSLDYAITCVQNKGRYTAFNWGRACAVGVYDHANQSFSRQTGVPGGTSPFNKFCVVQRRIAGLASAGGTTSNWVENINTLVPSGTIIGSLMDWNIDKLKSVAQAQFGTIPLPAGGGTSVTMDYSLDNGQTFTNILTLNTPGATLAQTTNTLTNQFIQTTNIITYRITLNSNSSDHTLTPILKKVGFGAWYGEKPKKTWKVYIDVSDGLTLKNGAPYVIKGNVPQVIDNAPTLGDAIVSLIRNLWATQAPVSWQPPGYGDTHAETFVVQVRGYTYYRWYEPQTGFAGIVQVDLKESP